MDTILSEVSEIPPLRDLEDPWVTAGALLQCHYCRQSFYREFITIDHIVPRSRRGRDTHKNYVPSCQPCNAAKGNSGPECECRWCVAAVAMHQRAEDLFSFCCPKCGLITIDPADCGWCRGEVRE